VSVEKCWTLRQPDGARFWYHTGVGFWSRDARRLFDDAAARELMAEHYAMVTERAALGYDPPPAPERVHVNDLPVAPEFAKAFPLDGTAIPDTNAETELIYRSGWIAGVCGDFLTKELEAGRYHHDPRLLRWRYTGRIRHRPVEYPGWYEFPAEAARRAK
jgi:hypothetical protein